MGQRTELILGASLKKETPPSVINTLKYLLNKLDNEPIDFPFTVGNYRMVLTNSSESFAVNDSVTKMWFSSVTRRWHICTRSNLKNYKNEIETFLEWIKPHIEEGSGDREMYAIVIYEQAEAPTIYYLED